MEKIPELVQRYGARLRFKSAEQPHFILKMKKEEMQNILKCEKSVIKDIKGLLEDEKSTIMDKVEK